MTEAIKEILRQMSEVNKRMLVGEQGVPDAEWYEKLIFNETRLYEALGKEDARTVLGIWRRYKETVQLLREYEMLLILRKKYGREL